MAPLIATRAVLPGMLVRGRGGILNVASTIAFQPGPYQATYGASKAFVLSLSQALWAEARGTGVSVTALCPGPTRQRCRSKMRSPIATPILGTGSALVLITGLLLWIGHFKLFTGWLLLGFLLYVAAAGLDGAFLAPNLRRARNATGEGSSPLAGAAMTIQLVAWLLLVVVVFLMVAFPIFGRPQAGRAPP